MKKQVGVDIGSYRFNASAKTITFNDCGNLTLDNLLLITNVTDHIIIYNFADNNTTGTIANNVLTLAYNTTGMSNEDNLQIFISVPDRETRGILDILRNIFRAVISPAFLDPALNRVRATSLVESGTVTTVTNLTNMGNYSSNAAVEANMIVAWQNYRNSVI